MLLLMDMCAPTLRDWDRWTSHITLERAARHVNLEVEGKTEEVCVPDMILTGPPLENAEVAHLKKALNEMRNVYTAVKTKLHEITQELEEQKQNATGLGRKAME